MAAVRRSAQITQRNVTMADTNPARALIVVKRVVMMCDFIEHPAITKAVEKLCRAEA
jgi:hypothetical protein